MTKTKVLLVTLPLLLSACASRPTTAPDDPFPHQTASQEKSAAGETAKGAGKGALGGGLVCATPIRAGAIFGPIGLAVGGILSLYCLPFGLTLGAIAGGLNAARTASPTL